MLTIRFGPSDLASLRFGVSPLIELWESVRALQGPVGQASPGSWLADARAAVRDLDFATLCALQSARGGSPAFVRPPPEGSFADLELELARIAATPAEQVRREISGGDDGSGAPDALRAFIEAPDAAVHGLSDLLRAYWQRVLATRWQRIQAALDGDVLYRALRIADGGIRALFGDIDRSVRYADGELIIDRTENASLELRGQGLLLVPSVFLSAAIIDVGAWQPTLIYPSRGSGLVWEPQGPPPESLAALIGPRRAAVLASLEAPSSTTALAHRLQVCPGSVSQHLAVLHDAGLIERQRVGRVVLYRRSAAGNLLCTRAGRAGSRLAGPMSGLEAA
jgi:DNA-binding transcriptional ArsR family regulator